MQKSKQRPEYFTVAEFAALLRVQKNSVYRWIKRGDVHAVQIRYGLVRIPAAELDRLAGGAA